MARPTVSEAQVTWQAQHFKVESRFVAIELYIHK